MVLVLELHGGDFSLDVPRQLRRQQKKQQVEDLSQARQRRVSSFASTLPQETQHDSALWQETQHDLADALFHQCGECNKMASLPQAAFAVHKLRKPQNEKNLAVARQSMDKQESPRFMKTLDLTPVKYSEKLMNSIWGLYNRYSPHNFKKNNGSDQQYFSMPQPFAVACAASEQKNSGAKNVDDPWK